MLTNGNSQPFRLGADIAANLLHSINNDYKYGRSQAMITSLKLTKIGTSTGAVLPKEMLARMKVEKGDTLYAIEAAEGYLITPLTRPSKTS